MSNIGKSKNTEKQIPIPLRKSGIRTQPARSLPMNVRLQQRTRELANAKESAKQAIANLIKTPSFNIYSTQGVKSHKALDNPGNHLFNQLIEIFTASYSLCGTKIEKIKLHNELKDIILNAGGKFVKTDANITKNLSGRSISDKISHAFRYNINKIKPVLDTLSDLAQVPVLPAGTIDLTSPIKSEENTKTKRTHKFLLKSLYAHNHQGQKETIVIGDKRKRTEVEIYEDSKPAAKKNPPGQQQMIDQFRDGLTSHSGSIDLKKLVREAYLRYIQGQEKTVVTGVKRKRTEVEIYEDSKPAAKKNPPEQG